MLIELKICLPKDRLHAVSALHLSALREDLRSPRFGESVRLAIEFAPEGTDPLNFLVGNPSLERRALIVVSPRLVDNTHGPLMASDLAMRLLKTSWPKSLAVGLVGVAPSAQRHVFGLDAVIREDIVWQQLADAVQEVALRLWHKTASPKPAPSAFASRPDLYVAQASDRETFKRCLRLRHEVYASLGYLDDEMAASSSKLELDCYDTRARHFAVTDRNNQNRVVATARLISPANRSMITLSGANNQLLYEKWCDEFARQEPGRVFRDILSRPHMAALPILDSFTNFFDLKDHERYQPLTVPRYACELSRVVVHPDYRGLGILQMLIKQVLRAARTAGKRYLLLECAPFHEHMYRKFGFEPIHDNGQCYYMRAQRLDSWAVAMHHDLDNEHRIKGISNVYRIPIERPDQVQLEVAISHSDLDAQDIEARLRPPVTVSKRRELAPLRIAKSTDIPFLAELRLALREPGGYLPELLRELYARLPDANVRLLSGTREHIIAGQSFLGDVICSSEIRKIAAWLEDLYVTV